MAEAVSEVEASPNRGVRRPLPDSRSWLTGPSVRSNLRDENSIRLFTKPDPQPDFRSPRLEGPYWQPTPDIQIVSQRCGRMREVETEEHCNADCAGVEP